VFDGKHVLKEAGVVIVEARGLTRALTAASEIALETRVLDRVIKEFEDLTIFLLLNFLNQFPTHMEPYASANVSTLNGVTATDPYPALRRMDSMPTAPE
jgi:hypothetical protein